MILNQLMEKFNIEALEAVIESKVGKVSLNDNLDHLMFFAAHASDTG